MVIRNSINNGTLFKSRDEIFIRGEGCNTPGVPEGVTLLEFEGANQEEEPEVQEADEAVAAEELPECPDHQPSSFLKDDLLYQGFCKYCLHPAGDED
ncbi:uncharacterized protein [Miscanthus floridulus]|uniref:uncharacterized protein isoform X2 n=1 Tax=Miscanthus floridulus TaxID=154761 RepID=UPI0034599605